MKILIVEDDTALQNAMVTYLSRESFVCDSAFDFTGGLEKITANNYECILVDIGLPFGIGMSLVQEAQKMQLRSGVIIISAKDSVDDKVAGLNYGADDYLVKPFSLSELNARIKAVLRRKQFEGQKNVVEGEISINTDRHEVTVFNEILTLTPTEYKLLLYLIANKNRVISKNALAEHVWDGILNDELFDSLYTHIKNLRRKLIQKGSADYIKTVYGIGYKFKTD